MKVRENDYKHTEQLAFQCTLYFMSSSSFYVFHIIKLSWDKLFFCSWLGIGFCFSHVCQDILIELECCTLWNPELKSSHCWKLPVKTDTQISESLTGISTERLLCPHGAPLFSVCRCSSLLSQIRSPLLREFPREPRAQCGQDFLRYFSLLCWQDSAGCRYGIEESARWSIYDKYIILSWTF